MENNRKETPASLRDWLTFILLSLPWPEIMGEVWRSMRQLSRGLGDEGIYEVLKHEATLDLQDAKGKKAQVHKRQTVRYLQNHISAYEDQAWGDGDILVDYRCKPGQVVDRWRPGQKTFLLISLRDTKQRGESDRFEIEWGIRNGFTRPSELWETEIRHRTKQLRLQVIFPKARPPRKARIMEHLSRRTYRLDEELKVRLPDVNVRPIMYRGVAGTMYQEVAAIMCQQCAAMMCHPALGVGVGRGLPSRQHFINRRRDNVREKQEHHGCLCDATAHARRRQ